MTKFFLSLTVCPPITWLMWWTTTFMNITHVIRGEEWLPSAPLHVLLYQFFAWDTPTFAHLPLILKPEGNGKLGMRRRSPRVSSFSNRVEQPTKPGGVIGLQRRGYFAEAFTNMLAFLGGTQELLKRCLAWIS